MKNYLADDFVTHRLSELLGTEESSVDFNDPLIFQIGCFRAVVAVLEAGPALMSQNVRKD